MGARNPKPEYNPYALAPSNWVEIKHQNKELDRMNQRHSWPPVKDIPQEWRQVLIFDVSFFLLTLMTLFHA